MEEQLGDLEDGLKMELRLCNNAYENVIDTYSHMCVRAASERIKSLFYLCV